jgi:putative ABC transport system permease protein
VAFAVLLVFIQIGMFLGLISKATVTIDNLNADIWVTSLHTPNVDFAHTFPESAVSRVRSVPGVMRADNLIVQFSNIMLPTGVEESVVMYAMTDFRAWDFPWQVMEGDVDDLRRGNYFFLDDYAQKRYGAFSLGDYREIQGCRLKIIGRTKGATSFTTTPLGFMDYELLQRIFPERLKGNTTYIIVKLAPGASVPEVKKEIQRRLPYNDVFTKQEWAHKTVSYWIFTTGLGASFFLTVGLGCLVGVVVVALTLYNSTMEHIKEFATVKAIGGSNRDLYSIIGKQAVMSGLVGFVLGFIGMLPVKAMFKSLALDFYLPVSLVVYVFGGTMVFCILSALLSFRKVATADPAIVFRG